MLNKLLITAISALLVCNAFASSRVSISITEKSALTIQAHGSSVAAKLKSTPLTIDRALVRDLKGADSFFSVGQQASYVNGKTYLMLVTQTPSAKPSSSFCGSGTEDHLRLIEIDQKRKRLIQKDEMLIQSCLKSIVLQDDQATPLPKLLASKLDATQQLKLQWLSHPEIGTAEKTIAIESSKLVTH